MRQRPVSAAGPPFRDRVRAVLEDVRDRTLALVAPTPEPALVVQHSPSTSPVVRDLGHMAAFEDLWSAVFLGSDDSRVLGGGSWAPRPAVARCTFRNRDDPIRRRIFAGLRLARGGTAG